ncbi:hypothetical protein, partial [Enterobacter intestinihominis]
FFFFVFFFFILKDLFIVFLFGGVFVRCNGVFHGDLRFGFGCWLCCGGWGVCSGWGGSGGAGGWGFGGGGGGGRPATRQINGAILPPDTDP